MMRTRQLGKKNKVRPPGEPFWIYFSLFCFPESMTVASIRDLEELEETERGGRGTGRVGKRREKRARRANVEVWPPGAAVLFLKKRKSYNFLSFFRTRSETKVLLV